MRLTVSEASFHSGLAPLLWARGEVEHHGGRVWQRKAAQFKASGKQSGRKGPSADTVQGHSPRKLPPRAMCYVPIVTISSPFKLLIH